MLLTHVILVVGLERLTDLVCLAPEIIRVYKIMVSPVVGVDNFVDIYLASQLTSLVIFLQVRANVIYIYIYVQGERVRLIDLSFYPGCAIFGLLLCERRMDRRRYLHALPPLRYASHRFAIPRSCMLVKYHFFFSLVSIDP